MCFIFRFNALTHFFYIGNVFVQVLAWLRWTGGAGDDMPNWRAVNMNFQAWFIFFFALNNSECIALSPFDGQTYSVHFEEWKGHVGKFIYRFYTDRIAAEWWRAVPAFGMFGIRWLARAIAVHQKKLALSSSDIVVVTSTPCKNERARFT